MISTLISALEAVQYGIQFVEIMKRGEDMIIRMSDRNDVLPTITNYQHGTKKYADVQTTPVVFKKVHLNCLLP
jgi:hypothetical protein